MIALLVAEFVLEVVLAGAAVIYLRRVGKRHHREYIELLSFIEQQIRTTRHAVKNLAAALRLERAISDLGDEGIEPNETTANR